MADGLGSLLGELREIAWCPSRHPFLAALGPALKSLARQVPRSRRGQGAACKAPPPFAIALTRPTPESRYSVPPPVVVPADSTSSGSVTTSVVPPLGGLSILIVPPS